jgi:hypothetical protein
VDESFQVVFSTDCSGHLDWQSTLAFLSARRVDHEVRTFGTFPEGLFQGAEGLF